MLVVTAATLRGGFDSEVEIANGNIHRGVEAAIDLPLSDHRKNEAGTDGAGLCVWASIDMLAKWGGVDELQDLFARMKRQKGGGWPERVARVLDELAPSLPYVQYEGSNPAILDAAMRTGRPAGITYGYGKFYNNQTIAHMVVLAHLDDEFAAVIDNNNPGKWTWMSRAELLKRWVHPSGQGWAVVLLAPPPPLPPTN